MVQKIYTQENKSVIYPSVCYDITWSESDHKPSWKVYGEGGHAQLSLKVTRHGLEINASETSFGEKRDTTKELFLNLDMASTHAIYQYLKEKLDK